MHIFLIVLFASNKFKTKGFPPSPFVTHLQIVQPLLQRLQHSLHLLRRGRYVPRCHVFILPLVVDAVPPVGSLPPHGAVVRRVWYEVSMATLLVAIVPVVGDGVMVGRPGVLGVRGRAVEVVVGRRAASETLAQRELGRQLPDGLPLVQDGLLLLDEALPEVEDGGFCLLTRPPPASRRGTLMTWSAGPRRPYARTPCREAGGVRVHGNRGAYKAWVGSVVIIRP